MVQIARVPVRNNMELTVAIETATHCDTDLELDELYGYMEDRKIGTALQKMYSGSLCD